MKQTSSTMKPGNHYNVYISMKSEQERRSMTTEKLSISFFFRVNPRIERATWRVIYENRMETDRTFFLPGTPIEGHCLNRTDIQERSTRLLNVRRSLSFHFFATPRIIGAIDVSSSYRRTV